MPEEQTPEKYIPKGFRKKVEVPVTKCTHEKPEFWPFSLCADCIRNGPVYLTQ